jgi:hypothetical protein
MRILLSWQVTVGFDCEVYKYIPSTYFRGLLLICSTEKHLLVQESASALVRVVI